MILDTGKRAAALIEGLLTFARKSRQETAPVAVHEVINNLNALLSRTINKNVTVTLDLSAPDPCVLGDRAQIQNTLLNLAVNAADAMPDGGTLSFSTRMVTLTEASMKALVYPVAAGEYLEIAVSDTGTGIPPEIRGRIFEPFFTTKDIGRGTGLGLASVYGTLQGHAGGIALESEPGRGTTFRLYFKTVKIVDDAAPVLEQPGASGGVGRILLVDDEGLLRNMGREMLQELGYEAVLCSDGQEAVEVFGKRPRDFSAVVLDMIMPRMAGEECFLRLREINPGVRVILSTGYSGHTRIAELLDKGAAGFLPKPYNINALAEILQKVLQKS
jgi:CheY-like chemotaxis protein